MCQELPTTFLGRSFLFLLQSNPPGMRKVSRQNVVVLLNNPNMTHTFKRNKITLAAARGFPSAFQVVSSANVRSQDTIYLPVTFIAILQSFTRENVTDRVYYIR